MKTNQTISILFWINIARAKEDHAKLFARISVNGKRVNLSLKEKVPVSLWDNKRIKLKGTSPRAKQLNAYMEATRNEIFQCYRGLQSFGAHITAQAVKARYLGEYQQYPTMRQLMEYHNEKNRYILHKDTQKHYETSQKYILKYLEKEYKKTDCDLRDLDYDFIIGFENFLRAYKPKNHIQPTIANNTVMKHIERLRKMVNMAHDMEWIQWNPFVKFTPKYIKTDRDNISEDELQRIGVLSCPLGRLNLARDLFVFGCYTGIGFSNILLLTKKSIIPGEDGNLWIVINPKKINQVKIPLLPKPIEIITKYEHSIAAEINQSLFPKLSNAKMTSNLKEIADFCKIQKHLSFPMARHTFATTVAFSPGIPLDIALKLFGYSKIAFSPIYEKAWKKKIGEDMAKLSIRLRLTEELDNQKN